MSPPTSSNVIAFEPPPPTPAGAREAVWLASHLQLLAGVLTERAGAGVRPGGQPTGPDTLREAAAGPYAAASIYRLLLDDPGAPTIGLSDCLARACAALTEMSDLKHRSHLSFFCESGCAIPVEHAFAVGAITVEVLTNAIVHAHPTGVAGAINVACRWTPEGVVMEIADDGVGLPEGFRAERDGGIGLRIVRQLAERIGGRWSFESGPLGLTFGLILPVSQG